MKVSEPFRNLKTPPLKVSEPFRNLKTPPLKVSGPLQNLKTPPLKVSGTLHDFLRLALIMTKKFRNLRPDIDEGFGTMIKV